MKKINYGFENSDNPIGMFEGIGISDVTEGAITADYIGIINHDGDDYLIGKTTLAFKNNPSYEGKVAVRRVIADVRKDGSGTLFIDREETDKCKKIEEIFNNNEIEAKPIVGTPNDTYDRLTENDEINVVSIKHEVFEKKKMLKENKSYDSEEMGRYY